SCIQGLVRSLYEQHRQRLAEDVARREGQAPAGQSVRELMAGREYLFEDDFYHVDVSHLSSIVQMSVHLPPCPELEQARELCAYGQRLSPRFQSQGDPPFDDQYRDYAVYVSVLAGDYPEVALPHFQAMGEQAALERVGTLTVGWRVDLLLGLSR